MRCLDFSNVIIFAADSGSFFELCEGAYIFIIDMLEKCKAVLIGLLYAVTDINIVPLPAITALGVSLTSLFFCLEMFSQMAQFRVERIEDAIRIAMKFIVAKIIIENSVGIAKGIYQMFRITSNTYISQTFDHIIGTLKAFTIDPDAGGLMDIGYILLFVAFIGVAIMFLVLYIKILITFIGIGFEMGIHQAVAPIALSTLCNDLARPTGIAFIKSFSATCLQVIVIIAIFNVFTAIMNNHLINHLMFDTSGLGIFSGLANFVVPTIFFMALNKAIKSASEITKRMFGA